MPENSNLTNDDPETFTAGHDDIVESGTLFEEAIHQLHTLQNNMIAVLVKQVAAEFKGKSDSYKKERYKIFVGHKLCDTVKSYDITASHYCHYS